jgi:hypothetical protein
MNREAEKKLDEMRLNRSMATLTIRDLAECRLYEHFKPSASQVQCTGHQCPICEPLRPYQQQVLQQALDSIRKMDWTESKLPESTLFDDDYHRKMDEVLKSMSCQHEWVNAGFTSIKMVCKKCDADKPT